MNKVQYDGAVQSVCANFERGRYLLQRFRLYQELDAKITAEASMAVLKILAFRCEADEQFTAEEQRIFDECGHLLFPAMKCLLAQIREMESKLSENIYCAIYEKYCGSMFHFDDKSLLAHMASYGVELSQQEFERCIEMGTALFSTLAFQTPKQAALLTSMQVMYSKTA